MIVNIELTIYPYRNPDGTQTTDHQTEGGATPWRDLSPNQQRIALSAVRGYLDRLERGIGKEERQ